MLTDAAAPREWVSYMVM